MTRPEVPAPSILRSGYQSITCNVGSTNVSVPGRSATTRPKTARHDSNATHRQLTNRRTEVEVKREQAPYLYFNERRQGASLRSPIKEEVEVSVFYIPGGYRSKIVLPPRTLS